MSARPSKRQMEYQDWELGIFVHFGIRTFCEGHRDWDGKEKEMTADRFAPGGLDCGQWAASAVSGGAKYMVFTAKHHDGFANWPSKYTEYGVASSPWKNGKGDVVREYVDACRKYGLKVGLYYSPADATSPYYSDPKAYDDYFILQLSELLGGSYGVIDMLWLDGCGSQNHQYDWPRIVAEIRRMQPEILLFDLADPDYRFIGNESGLADSPHWNSTDKLSLPLCNEKKQINPDAGKWLPSECDLMMRDINWFFSEKDEHTVKSPEELLGIYYYSVGRGCNMLINIGPDRRGLLPKKDVAALQGMRTEINRRFAHPVLTMNDFQQTGNIWQYRCNAVCLESEISGTRFIDHAIVQEDLRDGENIRSFRIRIFPYYGSKEGPPITVYEGYNVGHKAICQFPPVRCRDVIFEIMKADGSVKLKNLDFFSVTSNLKQKNTGKVFN